MLHSRGKKVTPQRLCVVKIMEELAGKHLSCEEIHEQVKQRTPSIGIATIYRTVQMLDEIGVVTKLNLDDGKIRYEISQEEVHNHHHLVCKNCGKIIEVKIDLLEDLEKTIESKYNFIILNHDLKFFGKCENCI
ncbi:MAG: Fur family transcriptional regulator [Filifactoraceae bacterium]